MVLLEVRNVAKIYQADGAPVEALRNVSLSVDGGEFIALVGRSGCGKSTLLNLCGAMDFPTSGEIAIDGEVTNGLTDTGLTRIRREKVGFIFQSFQLIHTLTAVENVELPLQLARAPNARQTALKRLDAVEMADYAGRLPYQLSGGQQQRIAIARALVHSPRLLLADEPTGNLDTVTGEVVLSALHAAARNLNVAILMATHSAESTSEVDRVVRMRDGSIEQIVVNGR